MPVRLKCRNNFRKLSASCLALPTAAHSHLLCTGLSLAKHGWLGTSWETAGMRLGASPEGAWRRGQTAGLQKLPDGINFPRQSEEHSRMTSSFEEGPS